MRKILRLAKRETFLLKKTILLITVILTVFLSAFMGIFSVRINFINGFFKTLDETNFTYYAGASFLSLNEAKNICGNGLFVGDKEGITQIAILESANGNSFNTNYYGHGVVDAFNGACIIVDEDIKSKFKTSDAALISGEWLDGDGQIVIEKFVADNLKVKVGDLITVKDDAFIVKGIYDSKEVEPDYFFNYYFYISGKADMQFFNVKVITSDASSAYSAYKKFAGKGYKPYACEAAYDYFYMISPVEITLNIVTAIILSVVVLIIYTLLMVFNRQRKQFMCLLKILGADNFTATGVYLTIIIGILLVSVSLGTALGLVFNAYFINLCTSIFQLPFKFNFNFAVPALSFLISCMIAVAVCGISAIKTNKSRLAEEIRCE